MDVYTEGDTAPPYSVVLLDGTSRYDASGASAVRVKVWRDGVLVVNELADHVGTDGLIQVNDISNITTEPGPVLGKVVVTNDTGDQTFPPDCFFTTVVHPAAPPAP
jgi:hypothetical protein